MKQLTINRDQAFLLLEALKLFCEIIKIFVDMNIKGLETEYIVHIETDNAAFERIKNYINANSQNHENKNM